MAHSGSTIENTKCDYDAFISHNSNDKTFVRRLARRLKEHRLRIWFDEEQLRPGLPWQPLLAKGLESSGSVVVVLGPSGAGPWQIEETQVALLAANRAKRPIIPVLIPECPTPKGDLAFLETRTWVDMRGGISDETLQRLIWGITGNKLTEGPEDSLAELSLAGRWILIAGSGGRFPRPKKIDVISRRVGRALARSSFNLVTCGWSGVDHVVARAFAEEIQTMNLALSGRLLQIMPKGSNPDFPAGRLIREGSEDEAWIASIQRADAVVLIGGIGGTYQTGKMALECGKPVLPLADTKTANFHKDSYKFYLETMENWPRNPASLKVTISDFEELANPSPGVADDLIRLLKRVLS
jgi:hypothetical protein